MEHFLPDIEAKYHEYVKKKNSLHLLNIGFSI